jgi:CMP-N-acetylneuraminic acid synthetase
MKTVAVVPARKNSKEIPNKNLVNLCGKPLIQHTLECAIDSGVIDEIIVTSDSEEILHFSKRFGAKLVAEPEKPVEWKEHCIGAVMNALDTCQVEEDDNVFLLLPTSPLRQPIHCIDASFLLTSPDQAVVGVTKTSPFHSLRYINDDNTMLPLLEVRTANALNMTRQSVRDLYRVNGAIFLTRYSTLLKYGTFHVPNSVPLVMLSEHSVDINTRDDLKFAETSMRTR